MIKNFISNKIFPKRMAPINLGLQEITEDISCSDVTKRWKYFGQDDHIRLYSKNGFIRRIEDSNFKVNELGINYFGNEKLSNNGITRTSVLYIVEKPS